MDNSVEKPEIAYLLPGLFLSGGINTALRHVLELRKRGRNAVAFCLNMEHDSSWCPFIDKVPCYPFSSYYEICGPSGAKHLVATWWETAFDVAEVDAGNKHYFLQSIESRLFPDSHPFHHAFYLSLLLGLHVFTEARWIRNWLKADAGILADVVPNGVDPDLFHPVGHQRVGEKLRVLIEGSTRSPFKGVKESFAALENLDVETWYVSPDDDPDPAWRVDRCFKGVPQQNMAEIYSQCDVLLKLSSVEGVFGPPLEMMACGGTCVVGNVTGADEYCVHDDNCLMVDLNEPGQAEQAVRRLMDDKPLLDRLKTGGLRTAAGLTWEKSGELLATMIFTDERRECPYPLSAEIRESFSQIKRHLGDNLQMCLTLDDQKSNITTAHSKLDAALKQNSQIQARLESVEEQWRKDSETLSAIVTSPGWRFIEKCSKIRDKAAPPDTLRRRLLEKLYR